MIITWEMQSRPQPHGFGGSKHTRWKQHPDGRWYVSGGDYFASGTPEESGQQFVSVYDPADHSFTRVTAYTAPEGAVNAQHPDETGWVWDGNRQRFWLSPGYQGIANITPRSLYKRVMTFDPATREWADDGPVFLNNPANPQSPGTPLGGHAFFDAVADRLYHFFYSANCRLGIYSPTAHAWSLRQLDFPQPQQNPLRLEVVQLGEDYMAHDESRRRILAIDPRYRGLAVYDIASGAWINRNCAPVPPSIEINTRAFCWDGDHDLLVQWGGKRTDGSPDPAPGTPGAAWPATNEAWAIPADGTAWEKLEQDGDVPPRMGWCVLLWDRVYHRLMLIPGPYSGAVHQGQFWFGTISTNGGGGHTMKTATYTIALADESFSAGTPQPTNLVARATGPAPKSASVAWDPTATAATIVLAFDEATEAGAYQGTVDLVSGTQVLKTLPAIPFTVPAGGTTVTYRSPAGFTVTVG